MIFLIFLFPIFTPISSETRNTKTEYQWVIPILEDDICSGDSSCTGLEKTPKLKESNEEEDIKTFCVTAASFADVQRKYKFKEETMDIKQRLTYLLGINGIRNKIAMDWKVSNMNRLHWSPILQKNSEKFLWKCQFTADSCKYLSYPKIVINQNLVYLKNIEIEDNNPYGYAVRKWYSEFVKKESSFEEFETRYKRDVTGIENFTNMIWPTAELMGCASAK